MEARATVLAYWDAMRTNDFAAAARWLAEDVVIDWPQSRERVNGRANFAALNHAYPTSGRWTFTLNRIVAEGAEVVTDVTVSDGTVIARAVTFHEVADGLIRQQTEYWPDDYPAPAWRRQWVERY
ncbi:nuclear transport factor 2 family protein [Frigidibacter sp. RF13]|uniref:nuclear transport factor 2 family protein n=1 Tax=Frigidibacter sp. RF13 TaxID=2997340 RepID=UPI00226F354B|nr:nuclear transport factor 2 family protein [Frigidibacter sp. RF13]MCY1126594.1 nuclear transport factor 2 family protein [Frigidibacter sp. RF13]